MLPKTVQSKSLGWAILVFILAFASVILISWVAYYFKIYYKTPVDPNNATILAAITGFWGSIVGGVIGGIITFFGVKMTIDKNDADTRKKELQDQLASVIFLAKEIKKAKNNIERLPITITEAYSALSAGQNPFKNIDELKSCFQADLKIDGWDKFILQIKSPLLLEKVWRVYDDLKDIKDSIKTDTADLLDRFDMITDTDKKRKNEKLRLLMRIEIDKDNKRSSWNKMIAFDTRKLQEILDGIDLQKKEMEEALNK